MTVTWQVLQTERFGSLLNQHVQKLAKEKFNVNLSFDRVEVGLIPLATRVVNLSLEMDKKEIRAATLGLEFGLRDIFSDDFSIGNLVIQDAIINLGGKKKNEKNIEINRKLLFSLYEEYILKKLPFEIRGIRLKNTSILQDKIRLEALDVRANFFQNIVTLNTSVGFGDGLFKELEIDRLKKITIDGVEGEIQITKKYIRLKSFKVFSQNSFIDLDGKLYNDDKLTEGSFKSFLSLNKIKKILKENEVNPKILPSGSASMSGTLGGELKDLKGEFQFIGKNLESAVYNFSSLNAGLALTENKISIISADGEIARGKIKLTSPTEVMDLNEIKFLYPDLFLEIKGLYTNDLFFFLPKLEKAKGFLGGPLKLSLRKSFLSMTTYEGFKVTNFKLNGKDKVVMLNPEMSLTAGSTIKATYEGNVTSDVGISFFETNLELKGNVGEGKVNMEILPGEVNLEAFGPISGVQMYGQGPVRGTIVGPFDAVDFNFDLSPNNFRMLDFNLGSIAGNLNFNTGSDILNLRRIKGVSKGVAYTMDGDINFKSDSDALNMKIDITRGSLKGAKYALKPIIDPLLPYFKNVQFNFSSSLILRGGLSVPKMDVRGTLDTTNVVIFSEDLESIRTNLNVKDNIVRYDNVVAKKVSGSLTGEGFYNMTDKSYSYKGTLANLRIKDLFYYRLLNLGLDGDAFGEFYGVGDKDNFSSRSHLRITNSNVENIRIKDSVITVYNNQKDLFFSSSLVGGEANAQGYFNLGRDKKKKSAIELNINTTNLRNFAGILGKHNIANKSIQGELNTTLKSTFQLDKLDTLNLDASLNKFNFTYPGVTVNNLKLPIVLEIKDGEFKNWKYTISGKGVSVVSEGSGNLRDKFKLTHSFRVDSSLSELLTDKILKSQGFVEGDHMLIGSIKDVHQVLNLKGESLKVKPKSLPGLISDLSFNLLVEDNKLFLRKAEGEYGNGRVKASGEILFIFPFPQMDISLNVEKSRFPILKRSGVVVSGDMQFTGKKLPYDLKGNLAIIKGEVIEEMNDLASSAINSDSYQRFIPVGYLEGNVGFINTDIALNSFTPIKIKNGLIDIGLGGNLRVFGSISSPKFNGELAIENPENKFLFKGHEFILSEGQVKFIDAARKESPELRFAGVSRINEYDVYINLNGPADNLNIEMSSNPPLSQEDILSLLTLGVTSDVSRNLGDRQRQSVTTLSIGSLIMDQLKINQSLNDSLGLRLSIQPEFIEDENNLLEGRVDDRAGGNRFRSSTVLKVQKKISKKVNLSLSSTVGGSVDQSQEMNVNYKINKSWSLEGIYEVRSNDELEQELPDSVGADVKFQWSF